MIAIGTNVITCYFCFPCNKSFHANMFKIKVPHKYRPGNVPLRYVQPTFDHRSHTNKVKARLGQKPKDSEACFICKEKIRFRERGAIATPCCHHFVHTEYHKKWNRTERGENKTATCAICRKPWDTTPLCAVCQRDKTTWQTCKLKNHHPQ